MNPYKIANNNEKDLENNPWKRNIKLINENIIELMELIKVNNRTKHLINNIIVGISIIHWSLTGRKRINEGIKL